MATMRPPYSSPVNARPRSGRKALWVSRANRLRWADREVARRAPFAARIDRREHGPRPGPWPGHGHEDQRVPLPRANGATDEFVELYNESGSPVTVTSPPPSTGWALVASDGVARFVVPNGTVIPARGHYLGINSAGYSLAGYPAGDGATASGNSTYTLDIPENAGLALFDSAVSANFTLAHRLDAVGSTSVANP